MSEKKKESSWLLNLIMLIVGIIVVMLAIFNYIEAPEWWPLTGEATAVFSSIVSLPIGAWILIAAIGLWQEQEWALGASWVCFTVIIANGFIGVAQGIAGQGLAFWSLWPNVVAFIIVLVAVVGFIYLLVTMKRYS